MVGYGVLEEHTRLYPNFSILAFAFYWACGLSWNEAWTNVKSSLLDIPMSHLKPLHIIQFKATNSIPSSSCLQQFKSIDNNILLHLNLRLYVRLISVAATASSAVTIA